MSQILSIPTGGQGTSTKKFFKLNKNSIPEILDPSLYLTLRPLCWIRWAPPTGCVTDPTTSSSNWDLSSAHPHDKTQRSCLLQCTQQWLPVASLHIIVLATYPLIIWNSLPGAIINPPYQCAEPSSLQSS